MYDLFKSLVAQLFAPLPITAAVFVLGLLLIAVGQMRLGKGCALVGVLSLVLLSWAPIADRLLEPFESRYTALEHWPDNAEIQAVVVLGGGFQPNQPWSAVSRLAESSAYRLMEGIRLWRQRPHLTLIVTGADRRDHIRPVADGYREAALALGVPAESLVVLDQPTDTGQEARAVRAALGEGAHVLLVTSASHMPRSIIHFQQTGLVPTAAPTHFLVHRDDVDTLSYWVPSARHLRKTERAFYEALGLIATRWE